MRHTYTSMFNKVTSQVENWQPWKIEVYMEDRSIQQDRSVQQKIHLLNFNWASFEHHYRKFASNEPNWFIDF